jgi:catechol 2,3-dioxygenase-like lactoylglutathione lyase family enzyme
MIKSLAFIVYPVTDLAATRRFYEGSLRLRLTHEFGGDWFEYDLGDTTFVLTSADAEHPAPVRGAVAAFEVDDLEAEVSRLRDLAVPLAHAITETPVCRFATVRDPDGSEVILHQRRKPS